MGKKKTTANLLKLVCFRAHFKLNIGRRARYLFQIKCLVTIYFISVSTKIFSLSFSLKIKISQIVDQNRTWFCVKQSAAWTKGSRLTII